MDPSNLSPSTERNSSAANELHDDPQTMSGVTGYPKLAKLMGEFPETAIFRRFRQLNMLHLLRLQAELHGMEDELLEVIEGDQKSDVPHRKDYSRSFFLLQRFAGQGKDADDSEQYELLLGIGNKLQEYNTALANANAVAGLSSPEKRPLKFLQRWIRLLGQDEPVSQGTQSSNFPFGTESTIWNFEAQDEYVSLDTRASNDRISALVRGKLLDIYHFFTEVLRKLQRRFRKTDLSTAAPKPSIREYNDGRLQIVSDGITAALASLFPTTMILILYFVKRMLVRIGLVIIFTTLFSVVMSFYPGAKKGEVFAAVAAFAAVEVVFIGSTSS
ncbi:hypothetical protein F53441_12982 [Fusarium austroafricanum]|uniref:DUF6594 domain-containing protein n=1 Tax=Fusarium austroafricanum TaxID=2364996 RepID=A0A8H4JRI9_9HYPO|nr:hypothetical protein F53441_12982 [Fusarium austroafricanum]